MTSTRTYTHREVNNRLTEVERFMRSSMPVRLDCPPSPEVVAEMHRFMQSVTHADVKAALRRELEAVCRQA